MRRAIQRVCAVLIAPIFVISMTGCGEGTPSSPSPSPGPSPTPSPSPTPTPPPPAGLLIASLSLNQTSVQGQAQPIGTVTLTSNAPSGGALVQLSSSNPTVAQVPSSVVVAGGQSSAAFMVNTSTVPNDVVGNDQRHLQRRHAHRGPDGDRAGPRGELRRDLADQGQRWVPVRTEHRRGGLRRRRQRVAWIHRPLLLDLLDRRHPDRPFE